MNIGWGVISKNGEKLNYQGTMPFNNGDRVVVINEKDLEEVVNDKIQLLLKTGKEMPKFLYSPTPDENAKDNDIIEAPFPDEIDYTALDGTVHKLYLERKIYGSNLKDMLLIRYVSYDQACEEEDF